LVFRDINKSESSNRSPLSRGTESSNPSPSSGESRANLISPLPLLSGDQVHGGSTCRLMTLVAPRDCTNKAEGRMYLSSRRGVKRAGRLVHPPAALQPAGTFLHQAVAADRDRIGPLTQRVECRKHIARQILSRGIRPPGALHPPLDAAAVESRTRRLIQTEGGVGFIFGPFAAN
jgi:hypothetical protein